MRALKSLPTRDTVRYGLAAVTSRRTRDNGPAGLILVHHDVSPSGDDPRRSLTPALALGVLREQLLHLRRRHRVVSLDEFERLLASPEPRSPVPVALSFDDDLHSHHRLVAPLLSELGLPGTFFLTGRTLDGPASFWWHDLQQLFREGGERWAAVARALSERFGPPRVPLGLGAAASTIEAADADARDALIAQLRELAADLPTDEGVSAAAVRELVAAGFEIGFHTRGHYRLPALSDERLATEMRDGHAHLAEVAGTSLTRIAYPHGAAELRVAAAAQAAGFARGYTVHPDLVRAGVDPLLIPRLDGWMSASRMALAVARLIADRD